MNTVTLTEEYANGDRNFQGRHLSGANLGWMNLAEANFRDADFYGANLSGASLKQADFSGKTNLAFADLSRADLTAVDLRGANLEGANLAGTILDSAVYDEYTIFPRGFDPDTAGAITAKAKLEDLMLEKRATTVATSPTEQLESQPIPQNPQQTPASDTIHPKTSTNHSIFQPTFTTAFWTEAIGLWTAEPTTAISETAIASSETQSVKKSVKPWLISLCLGIGIPIIGLLVILKPHSEPLAIQSLKPEAEVPATSSSGFSSSPTRTEIAVSEKNITQKLSKQEAISLLANWLEAKKQIFGSSYNAQLVNQFTTGQAYEEIMSADGSLPWLKQNNGYYRYGKQNVTPLSFFEGDVQQAKIEARISEDLLYYENDSLQKTWTNNQSYRFILALEDGQWKISGRQKIDDQNREGD
jgi:hypothetical protein